MLYGHHNNFLNILIYGVLYLHPYNINGANVKLNHEYVMNENLCEEYLIEALICGYKNMSISNPENGTVLSFSIFIFF